MERKKAAFAGSWYPGNLDECKSQIKQFLKEDKQHLNKNFTGGIVPHAGWYFSGSLACRVINALQSPLKPFDVFVIFGMHMHLQSSPCILADGAWETPLGDLEIHAKLAEAMSETAGMNVLDPFSFPDENTIELQLPFIKYFFPETFIVPVGVPPSPAAEQIGISAVRSAEKLGLHICVLGSTDLTHYGMNYGFTPAGSGRKAIDWVVNDNDRKAVNAIKSMEPSAIISEGLENHNICCSGAVAAAASAAKKLGAVRATEIDYTTSYEKSPGESFVGYTGILFER